MTALRFFMGSVKYAAYAVLIIAALIALIVGGAYGQILSRYDGTAELPADCGIVFGAAVYGQNKPGPAITRRTAAAAKLWREGSVKRLIMTGGKGEGVRESEAQVMKNLAMELGVPGESILLEDKSHSTWENIANVQNLTSGCSSVIAISDGYHLARIELLSNRQHWELKTVPAVVPIEDRPPRYNDEPSWREVFAYIYYAFYIDLLLPELPQQLQSQVLHGSTVAFAASIFRLR